jgi:pimeloyl-ACP methyl ester carboxylesterase
VARRLIRARPEWGAVLIDLRQHGQSRRFPPPHTVTAAAADLGELADYMGTTPAAILGHSFGGKVALLFAGGAAGPAALRSLRQVWVIDSSPDARAPAGSAWEMLQLVRRLPDRFTSRDDLIQRLVTGGIREPVAQWMATNLEPAERGYRWRFDVNALEKLLLSFSETDAWRIVESPPARVEIHLVKAEDSSVLDGAALERAQRATGNGRTFVHRVSGGHWVNAENPDAIEQLLVQRLP